ncbi:MAG: DUF1257 domain-containing protein [Methanoregulaceae archaeon]|nr:DUF1257 domain-containing protein [Methanoregulaceae archaeon]MCU0628531.1 DUF1257 domain-containing protein [Methanoregulaceae archaeon]
MSHFTRIKTTLKDKSMLTDALHTLGYEVTQGGSIRGRQGVRAVDLLIRTKDGNGIGFVRDAQGCYNLVADWWGIGRGDHKILSELDGTLSRIQREYAERTILEKTKNDGFSVVERREEPDGSIRIVVRRWT